jgi:hypothetical protein
MYALLALGLFVGHVYRRSVFTTQSCTSICRWQLRSVATVEEYLNSRICASIVTVHMVAACQCRYTGKRLCACANHADAASNHVWPQSPWNHQLCPGFSHPQMYPKQVSTVTLPYMAFPESCNMKSVSRTRVRRKLLWMFCPHFFTGCSGIPFGAGCMQAPRNMIPML